MANLAIDLKDTVQEILLRIIISYKLLLVLLRNMPCHFLVLI
jgi:hypothetical protein